MEGATPGVIKSMLRTIKHVLGKRNIVLSYDTSDQEESKWVLKLFRNSNMAGLKDDMRNITNYNIYLMNA